MFGRISRDKAQGRPLSDINLLIFTAQTRLNPAYFPYVTGNNGEISAETVIILFRTLISPFCQESPNPAYIQGVTGNVGEEYSCSDGDIL